MDMFIFFRFAAAPFRKSTLGKEDIFLVYRPEKSTPIEEQFQYILVHQLIPPFTFSQNQIPFRIASYDIQLGLLMSSRVAAPPAPSFIKYKRKTAVSILTP